MHQTDPGASAHDLTLALQIADELDTLTMSRFRASDLTVTAKPDTTPVSDADTAAERLARDIIARHRPADVVLGEEYGGSPRMAGRQWIIDPIDGTKNFVRGVPVWASLLALAVDGEIRLGVVSAPALGRRWYAARGTGAWLVDGADPRRLQVSGVWQMEDASLSYSSLEGWREVGRLDALLDLSRRVWRTRGYGDFWSYMLLAEGAVDLAAEPELALYDMAALVPIVQEAGGVFTSRAGEPGPYGGSAVAANPHLHAEALSVLGL
ncbi:histidinol-phosphatase [Serinibacter salmoneus]|uniref:Histidinol-phosphatase n=1 Tax=Serinibacter salmoneus TaxID=556530 RepID=A0A2A9D389_9MICO|nr:histidinol-phosphatase [Serinibacter salmoneus]PFG20320.1 histidinol-phosphatase [Serinibacter salmoneus]